MDQLIKECGELWSEYQSAEMETSVFSEQLVFEVIAVSLLSLCRTILTGKFLFLLVLLFFCVFVLL